MVVLVNELGNTDTQCSQVCFPVLCYSFISSFVSASSIFHPSLFLRLRSVTVSEKANRLNKFSEGVVTQRPYLNYFPKFLELPYLRQFSHEEMCQGLFIPVKVQHDVRSRDYSLTSLLCHFKCLVTSSVWIWRRKASEIPLHRLDFLFGHAPITAHDEASHPPPPPPPSVIVYHLLKGLHVNIQLPYSPLLLFREWETWANQCFLYVGLEPTSSKDWKAEHVS